MPDEFSNWRRLHERPQVKEPFTSKAKHIHRYSHPKRENTAKREAEKDRVIFLWIMAALVAVGIVVAIAAFMVNQGSV